MQAGILQKNAKADVAPDRIEWCDVYRGILILLVVLVHTTYEFNHYLNQFVYQFFMFGFFFLSGYMEKGRNYPLGKEIMKKFYRRMVPYYTIHFAFIWIFWLMQQWGVLGYVSTIQYSAGYLGALKGLLRGNGETCCDWLGAMWFVQVLFLAEIIFMILIRVFRNDILLCMTSALLFLVSDWTVARWVETGAYYYNVDLAGMAQASLVAGYMLRKSAIGNKGKKGRWWQLLLKTAFIGITWWGSVQAGFTYTFDWPRKDVNGAVDLVLPVFGIIFTLYLAKLLSENPALRKLLTYLGNNSIGIMCFHFMGFKVGYLILIWAGRMDAGDAWRLIPGPHMSDGWPVVFLMGMAVSILLWTGLNRIPAVRFALGGGNAEAFCGGVLGAVHWVLQKVSRHWKSLAVVAISLLLVCYGTGLYANNGRMEVSFPDSAGKVTFGEGWFPQSDMEDYRWMGKQAVMRVLLTNQETVEFNGYVPEKVDNISYVSVKVNGKAVCRESVESGQLFGLRLDISDVSRKYWFNTFEIETDGIWIPGEEEEDQRRLSLYIGSIAIY